MIKMRNALVAGLVAASLLLGGCANTLGALATGSTTPPQLPARAQNISRAALDFAFNSFDAGLYAFDLAMDLKHPAPGSEQAKAIAAVGRTVLKWLNAAETARRLGNTASYDEAFRQAQAAMTQFKALLGAPATHALVVPRSFDREAVLARA